MIKKSYQKLAGQDVLAQLGYYWIYFRKQNYFIETRSTSLQFLFTDWNLKKMCMYELLQNSRILFKATILNSSLFYLQIFRVLPKKMAFHYRRTDVGLWLLLEIIKIRSKSYSYISIYNGIYRISILSPN